MARTLGDIVRRGVDSVLANWPLLLIRIGESVLLMAMMIGIVVAAVIPLVLAGIGGSFAQLLESAADLEGLLGTLSIGVVLYALLALSIAIGIGMLVHSFVQGGIIGCYVEAERRAPASGAPRDAFRIFTPELWWSESKRNVWRVFWIYNAVWLGYSLLLLAPLLPLAIVIVLLRESPAALVLSIVGLVAIVLFAIGLALVVVIWSQVVLIDAVRRGLGALEAVSRWREAVRGRVLNLVLLGGIFFALSMTAGGLAAGVTFTFENAGSIPGFAMAFLPLQIALSLANSIVSTLFGSWLLAALAAALAAPPAEVRHDVVAAP